MKDKEFSKEYNFIRDFNKISVSKMLKDNGISAGNFYTGRVCNDKEKIIKHDLLVAIHELLLKEVKNEQ